MSRRAALLRRQRAPLALLATMVVVTLLIQGDPVNLDTSIIIGIYSLIALSVGMTWGQAGILSIAQAALAAIGAYATAIATTHWGWSPYVGLVAAVTLPALVAYPLARVVTRLPPLALAIATFAFAEIVYELLRIGGDFTGGFIGITGIPPIEVADSPLKFNVLVWAIVVAVVALYANLQASSWGRAVRTIRHDRVRAAADGIDVPHALSAQFALSASVAGLGGWLYAHYLFYLAPDSLGSALSIEVLLMAIVGGAGFVLGPIVGAGLLTLLGDHLPSQEYHGLFYGAALIAVLTLAPRGLLGLPWGRLLRRRGRGGGGSEATATAAAAARPRPEPVGPGAASTGGEA